MPSAGIGGGVQSAPQGELALVRVSSQTLGMRVSMSEEQFFDEMEKRRSDLDLGPNDHVIGCPLCLAPLVAPIAQSESPLPEREAD